MRLEKEKVLSVIRAVGAQTPDALWIVGLALVALGVGLVFMPAGVIAAGLALCFIGYASGDAE